MHVSRISRVVPVLAAAAVAACAAGPDYHRPTPASSAAGYSAYPLPEQVGDDATLTPVQRLRAGAPIDFRWWRSFGSPALDSLIERSLLANPNVAAAQASLVQARELVSAQRGFFLPSVSAGYSVERQKLAGNVSGSSAPGVQGNGTDIAAVQRSSPPYNEPLFFDLHTASLSVGFNPDVFGLNRRKVEGLEAQARLQRFELEATYVSLAANVVAAAVQEASLRAQLETAGRLVDCNERSVALLRSKARLGYAMQLDLANQELALAQARALVPPLQKQFQQNRDLIRALAGRAPDHDLPETFALHDLHLPEDLPVSVPAALLEQRPDVRAAEEQLHAANADVGVAIAGMLPQFSITGASGGVATQFSQMFQSGGPFWSLIGGVTEPLFAGGTLLHTKGASEAALRAAAAQYQATVLQAYQNVADTLHLIAADAQSAMWAVEAERDALRAFEETRRRGAAGFTDRLAELAADAAYQQAELNRAQAQAARLSDSAALFQALGGGWWNRAAGAPSAPLAAADGR